MKKSNTFQICWPFQNTSDVLQLLSICSVCQPVSSIQHTSVAGFIWCILLLLVWKPLASLAHLHPDKNKVDCVFCTSSLPPPKHYTNTFLSLPCSLSHTQSMSAGTGRCLLSTFQYEHHNILSSCHPFPCHKPTRASSFHSWTLWDKNHIHFPTKSQMSLC